jgi:DNA polymerase-3 subunit epsilon
MEVLLAQIEKYENKEWEDKKGNITMPVVNDIEALHQFTNLNRPVDFAGRLAYNEQGEEVFNFGKHKGKKVEDIFATEPSYYSWMMQGDFPLYTKRKLEQIFNRWNAKRQAERQAKPAQPKPVEPVANREPVKPYSPKINQGYNNSNRDNQPNRKKEEPAAPVNEDMLKLLADKFKKGL